jgi:cell division protein FtsN
MNYDFSFSKKAMAFVLAGSGFVGAMLFIAGLLIGTNWKAEPNAAASVAGQPPVAAPTPEPPATPPEPLLTANTVRPSPIAPARTGASSDAPAPVKQAHADAASVNRKTWQSPAPAYENDGELKIIQEAEPAPNEAAEIQAFSVEVGVFVSESDAHQLVRQLQQKGYTPIVLAASDDESRLWYSVRIGSYDNETEAAQAASNIAGQEKLKAVVRPLGSL